MSIIQHVTHHLPWFVRDPAIALIGSECYTTLVWNVDLTSTYCINYALSKVLGLGLVLGGSIVKVPQIMKILSAKNARGLSLSSYILDTASLGITVAYNARNRFPWSTYGENVFLLIQNVILTALIIMLSSSSYRSAIFLVFLAVLSSATAILLSEKVVPLDSLKVLAVAAIPLSLSSKVPQIISNARRGSTGQLSAFLVFSSLAGCLGRVFTTTTETGDVVLWWGFVLASALNAVLALQMAMYWNEKKEDGHDLEKEEKARVEPAHQSLDIKSSDKAAGDTPAALRSTNTVSSTKETGNPSRLNKLTSPPKPSSRYTRKLD